jgi:hypothetical protein
MTALKTPNAIIRKPMAEKLAASAVPTGMPT